MSRKSSPFFILPFTSSLRLPAAEDKSSFENRSLGNQVPTVMAFYLNLQCHEAVPYWQHDIYHGLCNCLNLYWKILNVYLRIFEGMFSFSKVFSRWAKKKKSEGHCLQETLARLPRDFYGRSFFVDNSKMLELIKRPLTIELRNNVRGIRTMEFHATMKFKN